MPKGVRKPKPLPDKAWVETIHDRIKAAEKELLSGISERVLVSDEDLEKVVSIIREQGLTRAHILKRAVHLGLQVMSIPLASELKKEEPVIIPFETYKLGSSVLGSAAEPYPDLDTPTLIRGGGRWRDGAAEGALPPMLGITNDFPEQQEQDGTAF